MKNIVELVAAAVEIWSEVTLDANINLPLTPGITGVTFAPTLSLIRQQRTHRGLEALFGVLCLHVIEVGKKVNALPAPVRFGYFLEQQKVKVNSTRYPK